MASHIIPPAPRTDTDASFNANINNTCKQSLSAGLHQTKHLWVQEPPVQSAQEGEPAGFLQKVNTFPAADVAVKVLSHDTPSDKAGKACSGKLWSGQKVGEDGWAMSSPLSKQKPNRLQYSTGHVTVASRVVWQELCCNSGTIVTIAEQHRGRLLEHRA